MPTDQPEAERTDGGERCHRCGVGDECRTLRMECGVHMPDLGVPFAPDILFDTADPTADCLDFVEPPEVFELPASGGRPAERVTVQRGPVRCRGELVPRRQYTLRVCERCRADWLAAIQRWFRTKAAPDEPGPAGAS